MSKYLNEERMKKIAHNYFTAWNEHDLVRLRKLFDKKIVLKDWDIYEIGIENVLKANLKIFESVPSIKVNVINIGISSNKVMAEIKVILNKEEIIDVVDIIQIEKNLITNIKAFKC